jgi:hypothetical protein
MPKNCYHSFGEGQSARINYPLRSGRYKLEEQERAFLSYRNTLVLVRDRVIGKSRNIWLGDCMASDKHVWLKKLPLDIANCLGYNLLPGLLALSLEGAQDVDIKYPAIEGECLQLLDRLERVRRLIKNNINIEYEQMKRGGSLLEPLVDDALEITRQALGVK